MFQFGNISLTEVICDDWIIFLSMSVVNGDYLLIRRDMRGGDARGFDKQPLVVNRIPVGVLVALGTFLLYKDCVFGKQTNVFLDAVVKENSPLKGRKYSNARLIKIIYIFLLCSNWSFKTPQAGGWRDCRQDHVPIHP